MIVVAVNKRDSHLIHIQNYHMELSPRRDIQSEKKDQNKFLSFIKVLCRIDLFASDRQPCESEYSEPDIQQSRRL